MPLSPTTTTTTTSSTTLDNTVLGLFQGFTMGANIVGLVLSLISFYGLYASKRTRSAGDFLLNCNTCVTSILFCLSMLGIEFAVLAGNSLYTNHSLCQMQGMIGLILVANWGFICLITAFTYVYSIVYSGLPSFRFISILMAFSAFLSITMGLFSINAFGGKSSMTMIPQSSGLYGYLNMIDKSPSSMAFNTLCIALIYVAPIIIAFCYFYVWSQITEMLAALPIEISDTAKKVGMNVLLRGTFLAINIIVLVYGFSSVALYQLASGKRAPPVADAVAASLLHLISVNLSFVYLRLDKRCKDKARCLLQNVIGGVFDPMPTTAATAATAKKNNRQSGGLKLQIDTTSQLGSPASSDGSLEQGQSDYNYDVYTPIF